MPMGACIRQIARRLRSRVYTATAPAAADCIELSPQRQQLHSVRHPHGHEIRCLEGRLWLTFEHCPVDVFLDPGDSLHCGTHQGLLIQALKPARCLIV